MLQPITPRIPALNARLVQVVLGVGIVGAPLLAYFIFPAFHAEANHAFAIVTSGDAHALRAYLLSFGIWASVVSVLLMIAQAVVAPIPAFLVVFANGLAFGVFGGWLVSLIGQTLAATVCYWVARLVGRAPVEKLVGRFGLDTADRWFARWGAWGVFLTRLIPGVSFDAISYAAGLSSMGYGRFLLATVTGATPQILLYVALGQYAPGSIRWLLIASLLGMVVLAIWGGARAARARWAKPGRSAATPAASTAIALVKQPES